MKDSVLLKAFGVWKWFSPDFEQIIRTQALQKIRIIYDNGLLKNMIISLLTH